MRRPNGGVWIDSMDMRLLIWSHKPRFGSFRLAGGEAEELFLVGEWAGGSIGLARRLEISNGRADFSNRYVHARMPARPSIGLVCRLSSDEFHEVAGSLRIDFMKTHAAVPRTPFFKKPNSVYCKRHHGVPTRTTKRKNPFSFVFQRHCPQTHDRTKFQRLGLDNLQQRSAKSRIFTIILADPVESP